MTRLAEPYLSNNDLDEAGLISLAPALLAMTTLTLLCLARRHLKAAGLVSLAPLLLIQDVLVWVRGEDGESLCFGIMLSTPLGILMDAYCSRKNTAVGSMNFLYDGLRVSPLSTALELEMEDGDEMQATLHQRWMMRCCIS